MCLISKLYLCTDLSDVVRRKREVAVCNWESGRRQWALGSAVEEAAVGTWESGRRGRHLGERLKRRQWALIGRAVTLSTMCVLFSASSDFHTTAVYMNVGVSSTRGKILLSKCMPYQIPSGRARTRPMMLVCVNVLLSHHLRVVRCINLCLSVSHHARQKK